LKRIVALAIAVIMILSMTVPVMAESVGTSVDILQGGTGGAPIVVAKWEGPDDGDLYYPNYTDPAGAPGNVAYQAGTQVMPPLEWQAYKDVYYFALCDDPQGDSNISHVYVDVYHPIGSPAPYNENDYFKYQLEMVRIPWAETMSSFFSGLEEITARAFFVCAWNNHLIDTDCLGINPDTDMLYTLDEILELIDQQSGGFYAALGDLYYEQPAGADRVIIKAVDAQHNVCQLENNMYYVPVSMVEFDFNSFNFGQVFPGVRQDIDGNRTFAVPDQAAGRDASGTSLNGATVRNIGNIWSQITVRETDLHNSSGTPLGKTGDLWNVEYWARMGDPDLGGTNTSHFYPNQTVTLPDVLELSTIDKLDFSILINKWGISGTWTGTMTLGSVPNGFPWQEDVGG